MPASLSVSILPEHDPLAYNERRGTFVVQIQPPPALQKRPPLRLTLALDTSGSMAGTKISTALASAQAVVRALSADDTFACVTFSDRATTVLAPTAMDATGRQLAQQVLQSVSVHNNTNLGAGILTSLELSAGRGHVVVLTDGCPTEGVTSPDQLLQLTRGATRGATLSAFGFGRDVNPLLLSSLSEAGRGNYTFIEAGEPPVEAIAAELGGLLMSSAANVVLQVRPMPGATIERALRTSDLRHDDGMLVLELSALVADEVVSLPLEFSWREDALGQPIASLALRGYDVATGQLLQHELSLLPRFASSPGPLSSAAAREILLGRASLGLRYASQATRRSGHDLASELTQLHTDLTAYAARADLARDAQAQAALGMLLDARDGLARSGADERVARQDMVASSTAISKKRSTMMGLRTSAQQAKQDAFTSRSQTAGIDFVTRGGDKKA